MLGKLLVARDVLLLRAGGGVSGLNEHIAHASNNAETLKLRNASCCWSSPFGDGTGCVVSVTACGALSARDVVLLRGP